MAILKYPVVPALCWRCLLLAVLQIQSVLAHSRKQNDAFAVITASQAASAVRFLTSLRTHWCLKVISSILWLQLTSSSI